ADRGELRGQALHQRLFRGCQLLVGNRPFAGDAAQLLHELDERRVGLAGRHVAASAERSWTFAEREVRRDAVAVAFVFADVGVQARLKLSEESHSSPEARSSRAWFAPDPAARWQRSIAARPACRQ